MAQKEGILGRNLDKPPLGLASAFLSKSYAVSKKLPPLTNSSTSFN